METQEASLNRPKPVRICFVIDRLSRAGTESQLLLLLEQLDRGKVEPFLCLLDGYDDTSLELQPKTCPTLRLGVSRLTSLHTLRQAWHFWRFLRREHIDVVQTYFPDSTRFAAPIAKVAGVRTILGSRRNIGHAMTKRDARVARFYNRWFISKIVANCEAARNAVLEQEGARPDQVVVVPNIIDWKRFRDIVAWRPKLPGQRRTIGMVGNLREVKGPDLFIRSAQLVVEKFPDVVFEIAGAGEQAPYQRLIDTLGLSKNVSLLGQVVDVSAFLATLDVAVLPSRSEGSSNALREYMAAGRPIVATDVGGNAEALGALATECCVSANDHTALAARIIDLLSDDTLSTRIASSARKQLFHDFSTAQYGEILAAVFPTDSVWDKA